MKYYRSAVATEMKQRVKDYLSRMSSSTCLGTQKDELLTGPVCPAKKNTERFHAGEQVSDTFSLESRWKFPIHRHWNPVSLLHDSFQNISFNPASRIHLTVSVLRSQFCLLLKSLNLLSFLGSGKKRKFLHAQCAHVFTASKTLLVPPVYSYSTLS